METPLVTIGIPCYNVGKYIYWSIRSVLEQSYENFELIITDDGSTDDTVEQIRKFKDPRIHLIVDGENHGISFRLNQQIDLAKGDIFVRMDGDDIMFPNRVQEQVSYLLSHPEVDVVGSNIAIIDHENTITSLRENKVVFRSVKDYFEGARFCHPSVAGKIIFFRRYKYREKYNGCEDCDLWIRSFSESNFYTLSRPLLFYRELNTFKLETYLHRRSIGRKMQWENRIYANSIPIVLKCLFISYFRSFAMIVLHYLGFQKLLAKKRNSNVCVPDAYQKILTSIIE